MSVIEITPVVMSIDVKRTPADAFRIFTAELSEWWPLDTHALSPENKTKAVRVEVQPRVGGRVIEHTEDGREFHWGDVLAYEPGQRFAMTWQLGQPREQSSEVEVTFEPIDGGCRVTLVHSGWERMGDQGREMREGYNNGWATVFGQKFAAYAGKL